MSFWKRIVILLLPLLVFAAAERQPTIPASAPSVKFKLGSKWVSYAELEEQARDYLRKKGIVPPQGDAASFELFPKRKVEAFIGVRYGHEFGKPAWYLCFDRDGRIIDYDAWIVRG